MATILASIDSNVTMQSIAVAVGFIMIVPNIILTLVTLTKDGVVDGVGSN
jgi:hypothetical protein